MRREGSRILVLVACIIALAAPNVRAACNNNLVCEYGESFSSCAGDCFPDSMNILSWDNYNLLESIWDHSTGNWVQNTLISATFGGKSDFYRDAQGNRHLAYLALGTAELYYGVNAGGTGSTWNFEDTGFACGIYSGPSIVVDASGTPFIACGMGIIYKSAGVWKSETVESNPWGGQYPVSLAIDHNNVLHLGYFYDTNNLDTLADLSYATRTAPGTWTVDPRIETTNTPLGSLSDVVSLSFDSQDQPHLIYFHSNGNGVKHAYKTSSWQTETIDASGRRGVDIAIDSQDTLHVSYQRSSRLYYGRKSFGGTWTTEQVDGASVIATYNHIQADQYGIPVIVYDKFGLGVAWKANGVWTIRQPYSSATGGYLYANQFALSPYSTCGDGVCDNGEDTYSCNADCASVCGNNIVELGEQCDGTSDAACPGQCTASCSCSFSSAGYCQVQAPPCGGSFPLEIMRISDTHNAHGELPSSQLYPQSVCCPSGLGNTCSGTEGVNFDYVTYLSATTNAHAEFVDNVGGGDPRSYTQPVCLSNPLAPTLQCKLETTGQACSIFGADFGCVVTLSSQTNAHLASCTDPAAYQNKICCQVGQAPDTTPPTIIFIKPTPNNNTISQYPNNSGNFVNYIYVNVTADEPLGSCDVTIKGPSYPLGITKNMNPHNSGCWFKEDNGGIGLREGTYFVYVNATDLSGNKGSTTLSEGRRHILVAEFPTSTIVSPTQNGIYNFSRWLLSTISGTARDVQSGIAKVDVTIQNTSNGRNWSGTGWVNRPVWLSTSLSGAPFFVNWQYLGPFNTEGSFYIYSNATDAIGFEQRVLTRSRFNLDFSLPTTQLTVQYGGGTVGSFPTYSGQAQDATKNGYSSKIVAVEFQVSSFTGGTWVITTPWTTVGMGYPNGLIPNETVDFSVTPSLSQGLNRVEFRGVDGANNYDTTPATDTVVYDLDYPLIQIDSPNPLSSPFNGQAWATADPIRGQARDAQGWVTATQFFVQRVNDSLYFDPVTGKWIIAQTWISAAPKGSAPEIYDPWRWQNILTYTPDDIGIYRIKATATDDTSHTSAIEVRVLYDNENPTATLSPLPPWTITPDITVNWDGADRIAIASFLVEWSIAGGAWQQLLPPTSQPGTGTLASVIDGTTYSFRVTATDVAGNTMTSQVETTTVDLTPPQCTFTSPPAYATNPLTLSWTAQDTGSGVSTISTYVDDGSGPVDLATSPYGCIVTPAGATCNTLLEGSYTFSCSATDVAGNIGPASTANIVIDLTPPTGGLTEPVGPWINHIPFTVAWNYTDPVSNSVSSGNDHYNMQWDTGTGWTPAMSGGSPALSVTQLSFGAGQYGDPVSLTEGQQVSFQSHGWDAVGLGSGWSAPLSVTIDTVPPLAEYNVTDQNGAIVQPGLIGSTQVQVNSNASDVLPPIGVASGLARHTVWIQTTHNGVVVQQKDCGANEFCSTGLVDIQGADEVVFWIEALDNAGNIYRSPAFTLAEHPLANFVNHDLLLITGARHVLDVQIRNLQPRALGYLELNLTGYPLAGFTGGEGDFSSYIIAPDGRSISIPDLQSGGRGTLHVEVAGFDPGSATGLDVRAFAQGYQTTATDGDHATVSVILPPEFDAWTDWAIVLLIALSIALYTLRR